MIIRLILDFYTLISVCRFKREQQQAKRIEGKHLYFLQERFIFVQNCAERS